MSMDFTTLFGNLRSQITDTLTQQGAQNVATVKMDAPRTILADQLSSQFNLYQGSGTGTHIVNQTSDDDNYFLGSGSGHSYVSQTADDYNYASIGIDNPSLPVSPTPTPTPTPTPSDPYSGYSEAALFDRAIASAGTLKWLRTVLDNTVKALKNQRLNSFADGYKREFLDAFNVLSRSGLNSAQLTVKGKDGKILLVDASGKSKEITPDQVAKYGTIVLPNGQTIAPQANANALIQTLKSRGLVKNEIGTNKNNYTNPADFNQFMQGFFAQNPSAFIAYCYDGIKTKITSMAYSWTPLMVDINGDGLALTNEKTVQRHGKDTTWVQAGSDDVFIVEDKGNNQVALLGEDTTGDDDNNGFTAASKFDANGDGRLDAQDDAVASGKVKAWHDKDGDGVVDAGELTSLSDVGITSMNLNFTKQDTTINGNLAPYASKAIVNGQERDLIDVFFNS